MGGLFSNYKLWRFPSKNNTTDGELDLNNMRDGIYRNFPKRLNMPREYTSDEGAIIVGFPVNDLMCLQFCIFHNKELYVRSEWGKGSWSRWKKILLE